MADELFQPSLFVLGADDFTPDGEGGYQPPTYRLRTRPHNLVDTRWHGRLIEVTVWERPGGWPAKPEPVCRWLILRGFRPNPYAGTKAGSSQHFFDVEHSDGRVEIVDGNEIVCALSASRAEYDRGRVKQHIVPADGSPEWYEAYLSAEELDA